MTVLGTVALSVVALAAALCLARVVLSRSLADRVVALNVLQVALVIGIAVWSGSSGIGLLLNVMVVLALLGFLGTVMAALLLERKGTR